MRETKTHIYFWGTWFSQWAKGVFEVDGVKYNCAEQYMMAEKARTFGDQDALVRIMEAKDPDAQKFIGRRVKNYEDQIWKEKRYQVVKKANLAKFSQIPAAKKFMKKSGNKIIVEGSPYDKIWGVGLHYKDDKILNEKNWRGENLLGKVLMEVRAELLGESNE